MKILMMSDYRSESRAFDRRSPKPCELARREESRLGIYFNRRVHRLVLGVYYAGQDHAGVVLASTATALRSCKACPATTF